MSPRLALGTSVIELRDGETLVGSGAQANWRVLNRDLMARHFIVRFADGTAVLHPASDDAVVAIEGQQVLGNGCELVDGNLIEAGSASFLFWTGEPRGMGSGEQAPTPPAHLVAERWGVAYPLTRTSTAIGRDPSNPVVVRDPTASRFHAEIRREAGGYALHTMGSSGTRINGAELHGPRLLREGDVVEIAFTAFRFTAEPVAAGVTVSAEPVAVGDAHPAEPGQPTTQRRRTSLADATPTKEPPRNVGLLLGTGAFVVVMVVALFWLLR